MRKNEIKSKEDVIKYLSDRSEFERAVLAATFEIPRGKVSTYKRIAERIGKPRAYRAVGSVLHKNPLAPIVPCHRVVKSNGRLTGEEGCVESRRRLLEEEGIPIKGNMIKLSENILF